MHNFTIGQRQGINVGGGGPYFVVKKDLAKNILYVTNNPNDPALEVSEVVIHSTNWITDLADSPSTSPLPPARGRGTSVDAVSRSTEVSSGSPPKIGGAGGGMNLLARYRHQGELVPCTIEQTKKDHYLVKFKTPQKALASGQSIVFYFDKVCLGGGVIT